MNETNSRTREEQGIYINPPEELRMQRAESYNRNVFVPRRDGDDPAYEGKTFSQKDCCLEYLTWYASITPLEALKAFGCFRLSSVIARLRDDGHPIITDINEEGKPYAIYRYVAEGGE